ncbi:hypothetical protein [Fictibacillus sp. NRS-1165]|uniref:hypothetical protein n=1 Tax=Fictibacillus sp. NRS-1165 TaxID=3144463 RepID=UPI003D198861
MIKKPQQQKDRVSKKETKKKQPASNGERFKNVCLGIAALGTMLLGYIQFFM